MHAGNNFSTQLPPCLYKLAAKANISNKMGDSQTPKLIKICSKRNSHFQPVQNGMDKIHRLHTKYKILVWQELVIGFKLCKSCKF